MIFILQKKHQTIVLINNQIERNMNDGHCFLQCPSFRDKSNKKDVYVFMFARRGKVLG